LVLAAADIIIIRHDDVELIVYNEAQLCCFCCLLDPACEISSNTQSQRGKKEKREKDNEILFFSFFFVVGRYVPGLLSMRNISLIRAAPDFFFYQMDGRRNIGTELDPIR
jgi:hypothetical protein